MAKNVENHFLCGSDPLKYAYFKGTARHNNLEVRGSKLDVVGDTWAWVWNGDVYVDVPVAL